MLGVGLTSMMLPSAVLGTTMKSRDLGGTLSGSAAMSVSGCLVILPERLQPGQNAPWMEAWTMLPVATGLRWDNRGHCFLCNVEHVSDLIDVSLCVQDSVRSILRAH